MKVGELMAILEEHDEDAEVILVTQANYPLEHALGGVALRSEYLDSDGGRLGNGKQTSDVLLVEGQSLGYGSRSAWDVAIR
ncbi:MAG: hypothetical protein AB7K71_28630 [Polyangiaceae bacterium]